ncbi:MAG: HDOD domain-containing protein [Candidatus Hydrogenedentota bacterium]
MDTLELKRRIKLMRGLPDLPHLAREVVRYGPPEEPDLDDLAAAAAFDPAMGDVVRRAVAGATDVRSAVYALGAAGLGRLVFRHALRALFPDDGAGVLDRVTFWRRTVHCAEYAEAVAVRIESPYEYAAYVAGLLHNLGKLVLDCVAPEGYAAVLDAVASGSASLEAERRILGVDHTLAGKWVAERWGLPEPYISGIWLHHHPVGALDDTRYPVQLVEIIGVAAALARMHETPEGEARQAVAPSPRMLSRLGLTFEDLEELLAGPAAAPRPEASAPVRPLAAAGDAEAFVHLQRRVRRLDLLENLQVRLGGLQHLGAVLEALGNTMRQAFVTSWGFCCAADEEFACLEGRWWQGRREALQAFVVSLRGEQAGMVEPGTASQALPGPLREVLSAASREAWTQDGFAEMLRWQGFVVAPILAEGRSLGQIMLDCSGPGGGFTEEDFSDLRLFGRAAGMAISHLRNASRLRARNEEMVESLWRKEEEFHQRLRAERLAGIARLAAGAAHEINNPLAIISGRAQVMLGRSVAPEDVKGLEAIIEQSRRASQTLTDLMQFARPPQPTLEPMAPSFLLRQVMAGLKPRLERHGIQVNEQYYERLPRVRLDRRRIEQALVNLIVNAEQAMADTGGTLTVRTLPGADNRSVKILVSDTGPGIAADIRDAVFEPFFTTRPQGEATGLGLSVVQGIVDSHEGQLYLDSTPGKGATFTIVLPAIETAAGDEPPAAPVAGDKPAPAEAAQEPEPEPEPEPDSRHAPSREEHQPTSVVESLREAARLASSLEALRPADVREKQSAARHAPTPCTQSAADAREEPAHETADAAQRHAGERPTILVVDDDVDLREVLKETFHGRGYDALGASDAREALAMFGGQQVDLVILDIRIPRQDGLGLLRNIRARKADVPVIVVTGLATEEEFREAERLGARTCLHKPFELKRLLAVIEEVLGSRSAA